MTGHELTTNHHGFFWCTCGNTAYGGLENVNRHIEAALATARAEGARELALQARDVILREGYPHTASDIVRYLRDRAEAIGGEG